MKTPSSSGKKKKKISGVSPGMDLTRFGFSVKKRSASPSKTSPTKNSSNAGNNNEQDNLESPLKRHKASSPAVKNNIGAGSVGKGKGKENGDATPVNNDEKKSPAMKDAAASRTALYDLTQSSSSEEAAVKESAVAANNDGTDAAGKDKKTGANLSSLGGLASSIANQIVAASSLGNKAQQQQVQQQPVKQRRGKRDKVPNENKAKSTQQTKTLSTAPASSSVAKSLSPSKKKKGGNNNNNIQALALVRVINPHEITCSTAVANIRHPDQPSSNNTKQQSWTPRRIFNGAILGRSSSSANAKPNFVDLGIGNRCMGISRHHITVINVRVKSDDALSNKPAVVEDSQNNTLSQTSAASSSTKNSSASQTDPSTVTLQVSDNASNGVNVHRTKRGSRKVTFLSKGEKITLRIGDALEFYSNEKFYYCVVGLESLPDGTKSQNGVKVVEKEKDVVVFLDGEKVSAASTTAKKRTSGEGGKRNLAKLNITDGVDNIDAKKPSTGQSKAPLKTPTNGTTMSAAKSAAHTDEITDTPRFPPVTASPNSNAKSATKTTIVRSPTLPKKRVTKTRSPMGPKSPQKFASSDINKVNPAVVDAVGTDLESSQLEARKEEEINMIKKGDRVKARFGTEDWFGETQVEWYFGTVTKVTKNKGSSSAEACLIDVLYVNHEKETLSYPGEDLEKAEIDYCHLYPDSFCVGDSVDCFHQDGLRPGHEGRWYRGRIASISEDGNRCDVLYIDGDYESNIPTKEKKIRLINRVDTNGTWMMNKKTTIPVNESSKGYQYRAGQVTSCEGDQFHVNFSDGTSESFGYGEVATGVFAYLLKDIPQKDISLWPLSSSSSMASTARLRRQMRDKIAAMKESVMPKKPNKAKERAPKVRVKSDNVKMELEEPKKPVMREIVRSILYVNIDLDETADKPLKKGTRSVKRLKVGAGQWEEGSPIEEHYNESQDSCDNNDIGNKRKAKDFPPGLANVMWCALNSQEPQTGANLLRNMLCVQNVVPPTDFVEKLMSLIKFGPKAEGSSVYFKDPLRTQLASSYASALVSASSNLVRRDCSPIIGPSSWDDVEVLLSQSISQTENAISGRRLAQGLQLAACGSKLLSLMLKTELHEINLATTSFSFDATSLKLMPTVKVFKSEGLRNVLKAVVRHTTSCLVRHSKWILDHDVNELSLIERASAECCASEAITCLDSLGSVLCYAAWLFCAEERIDIDHPNCAFVIKDEFLSELTRSVDNLPEMSGRKKTTFMKNVKLHFLTSLVEEFAFPMQDSVGKMIGLDDVVDLV